MNLKNKKVCTLTIIGLFLFGIGAELTGVYAQTEQTLASELSTVSDGINNYQGGLEQLAVGYQFGKVNMLQINAYVNGLTDPLQYLKAVAEFSKLSGFAISQVKMEWALDSIPLLNNGLPVTTTEINTPAFFLYDRYVLVGYQYAQEYNYNIAKWNLTLAYNSFHRSMLNHGVGLYITDNSVDKNNERYYDEFAETIQVFLFFYEMGIPEAMIDANTLWQYLNQNRWVPTQTDISLTGTETTLAHYDYSGGFECEAGNFYQIAELYKYYNSAANITNIVTDASNRFLSDGWNSPQWLGTSPNYEWLGMQPNYVTVHQYPANPQLRLENTLTGWAGINGLYNELDTLPQSNFRSMLFGYSNFQSAWEGLLSSPLYNNQQFMLQSDSNGVSDQATAIGLNLLLLDGIIPQNGSLAIPVNDWYYEDVFSTLDADLYAFNITSHALTFSILNSGTFTFMYGTAPISQNFNLSGTYKVTFNSDYNSIINVQYLGILPNNRIYMTAISNNMPIYANQTESFSSFGTSTNDSSAIIKTSMPTLDDISTNVNSPSPTLIPTPKVNNLQINSSNISKIKPDNAIDAKSTTKPLPAPNYPLSTITIIAIIASILVLVVVYWIDSKKENMAL